jgi:uncharacterized protein YecE (DUF72 family)
VDGCCSAANTVSGVPGEPRAFVDNYMRAIAPLEPRAANVLAQFPPWFARDDDALRAFLDTLPPSPRACRGARSS